MKPKSDQFKSRFILFAWVFALAVVAIASRFILADWPNFKPVCAIAIFLGFLFGDRKIAMLAIVAVMLISDALIGFYEWPLMIAVYGSMLTACCIGYSLRSWIAKTESKLIHSISIGIAALTASVIFFLVSNTAVCMAGWYPINVGGLSQSLVAGIPFFKYTLAGDLCFTYLIFASYFAVKSWDGMPISITSEKAQTN